MIFILGELESGYDHIADTISALGGVEGPRRWIYRIGAVITGILVIMFGLGLDKALNNGKGSKIGPGFVILSGIGVIGSAIFIHENLGNPEMSAVFSVTRLLHLSFASLGIMGSGISPFFLYVRFKQDPFWKNYTVLTLVTGIFANVPSIMMSIMLFTSKFIEVKGLLEKLSVVFPLLWLLIISGRLLSSLLCLHKSNEIEN